MHASSGSGVEPHTEVVTATGHAIVRLVRGVCLKSTPEPPPPQAFTQALSSPRHYVRPRSEHHPHATDSNATRLYESCGPCAPRGECTSHAKCPLCRDVHFLARRNPCDRRRVRSVVTRACIPVDAAWARLCLRTAALLPGHSQVVRCIVSSQLSSHSNPCLRCDLPPPFSSMLFSRYSRLNAPAYPFCSSSYSSTDLDPLPNRSPPP